jgi:hypothetical protein
MRTTIRMDDALFAEVKEEAVRTGRTFTQVIEDAVRESLGRRRAGMSDRPAVRLPTFVGSGLLPGVDLDSTASLLDVMDADAPR